MAVATASVRSETRSFSIMLVTWWRTVFSLMFRSFAISLLVQLARSEIGTKHAIGQARGDMARNVAPAAMNRLEGGDHLGLRRVFEQVALRPCPDRTVDLLFFFEAGKNDHSRWFLHVSQRLQDRDAIHARHAQVQQ
jgi:hypothetical protein